MEKLPHERVKARETRPGHTHTRMTRQGMAFTRKSGKRGQEEEEGEGNKRWEGEEEEEVCVCVCVCVSKCHLTKYTTCNLTQCLPPQRWLLAAEPS